MSNNTYICSVAIENTTFSFDKLFDYAIDSRLVSQLKPGCRVSVPFGRGNKLRQAMVMSVSDGEISNLKYVENLLDKEPVLTEEMLKLAIFIKEHYFCTYYDAVKAMLPAGINYKITSLYSINKDKCVDSLKLSIEEQRVVDFLSKARLPVKKDNLLNTFGYSDTLIIDKLVKDGVVIKEHDAFRKTTDAALKMVSLSESAQEFSGKLTSKQNAVLELLKSVGQASAKEICYFTGVTNSVIDGLVKKQLVVYYDEEVFRTPTAICKASDVNQITLTEEQQNAYNQLFSLYSQNKAAVSLLYGITGSGKTSVFMKLIESVRNDGKGIIVMVPEISLTPQLVQLFCSKFGEDVAVFHSGLSVGERLDEYKRVLRGNAKIVVGTRSAAFAPLKNIGLIIMDEEQEGTYKSENTPRFHARDVAKFRVAQHNCLLLLSSATPDVETYHNALTGRYSMVTLKNRYGGAVLPDVLVADMNLEVEQGNSTGFSSVLLEQINQNLEDGKQSILLLNRRGHNTFVTCRMCKEPVTCPNCSISLTYHSANNRLMCHYCGYSIPYTDECPTCHNKDLYFGGAGTQRAEQELYELFSDARILRMDTDATMSKNAYEKKLSAFSKGEYDILIGTQMVAKGLNFPNVTLVGVLSADQMLYSDDYRSYERAFSLLTQVVGRSGRGKSKGRAIIQTFTPENPIISMASEQNYDKFFNCEIAIRKAMLYPPFADICMVGFVGSNHQKTITASKVFLNLLIKLAKNEYNDLPLRVLGPSAAMVSKVNNRYRYKIILKCKNDKNFRKMLSLLLIDFSNNKEFSDVKVYVDMKPLYF